MDDNKYSEYCKYLHSIASSFEKGNVSEDNLEVTIEVNNEILKECFSMILICVE